jgi:hypothetical protein
MKEVGAGIIGIVSMRERLLGIDLNPSTKVAHIQDYITHVRFQIMPYDSLRYNANACCVDTVWVSWDGI